ncbi:MAG: sigma-70 family RNA polymerase sigma factor, partial [Bacteroidota bacterium]
MILTRKIREDDQVAMEKLTTANLRFVVLVAKQYDRGAHNLTLGDLISGGNIGLIKAASKFDETRGFKFISYAVWWIRQAIISAISGNTRTIRQPMNRVDTYNHVLGSYSKLEQKYECELTNEEIADAMNVSEDYVVQIKKVGSRTASLNAPMQLEDAGNLLDVLKDSEALNPDGDSIYDSLKEDVNNALKTLTNRESEILV